MPRAMRTNQRAGTMIESALQRPRHALDRKDEPRQQHASAASCRPARPASPRAATTCAPRRGCRATATTRMNSRPSASSSAGCRASARGTRAAPRRARASDADEADAEVRRDLADDDLPGPQRRDEQRLHRARLLLARERDRRHQRRDDREHERHQPGHEQVRALARRVEAHARPAARCGPRRAAAPRSRSYAWIDRVDVGLHDAAGVRLGGVGDDRARCAGSRRARAARRTRARSTTATCARAALEQRLEHRRSRGTTATTRNTSRRANRLRGSPASRVRRGSTIASRTSRTSVRIAKPKRMTCTTGMKISTASVRRSRRM